MERTDFTAVVLRASNGGYLTQKGDVTDSHRVISDVIVLGKNDSESNYIEISKEEGEALLAKKEQERRKALEQMEQELNRP